jgi:hypothetical protein
MDYRINKFYGKCIFFDTLMHLHLSGTGIRNKGIDYSCKCCQEHVGQEEDIERGIYKAEHIAYTVWETQNYEWLFRNDEEGWQSILKVYNQLKSGERQPHCEELKGNPKMWD